MAAVKQSQGGVLSKAVVQATMRKHSAMYAALSPAAQAEYNHRAMFEQSAKAKDISDELQGLRVVRGLREARGLEEQALKGSLLRDSSCRLGDADYEDMAMMWGSPEFAPARIKELRAEAMVSPAPPAPGLRQRLDAQAEKSPEQTAAPRIWATSLCRLRSPLYECGLVFVDEGKPDRALAFLYATQRPMVAELLPLTKAEITLPAATSVVESLSCLNQFYEHQYTFAFGASVDAADVVFEATTQIFVLPDLAFLEDCKAVSHAELVPLLDYVTALMDSGSRLSAKPRASSAPNIDRALAEEFPWLTNYLSQGREQHGGGSSAESQKPEPNILGLDDAAIQDAFDELQTKRTEWRAMYDLGLKHFKGGLLGGAWTKQHKRAAADSVRAFGSGKAVHAWCKKFGLPADATFALNKFGEHAASMLANDWCRRSEYFYTLFLGAAKEELEYTTEMINACPPPEYLGESASEGPLVRERLKAIMAMEPRAASTSSSSRLTR